MDNLRKRLLRMGKECNWDKNAKQDRVQVYSYTYCVLDVEEWEVNEYNRNIAVSLFVIEISTTDDNQGFRQQDLGRARTISLYHSLSNVLASQAGWINVRRRMLGRQFNLLSHTAGTYEQNA